MYDTSIIKSEFKILSKIMCKHSSRVFNRSVYQVFHLLVFIERQRRLDTLSNLILYLIKQYQLNDVHLNMISKKSNNGHLPE